MISVVKIQIILRFDKLYVLKAKIILTPQEFLAINLYLCLLHNKSDTKIYYNHALNNLGEYILTTNV